MRLRASAKLGISNGVACSAFPSLPHEQFQGQLILNALNQQVVGIRIGVLAPICGLPPCLCQIIRHSLPAARFSFGDLDTVLGGYQVLRFLPFGYRSLQSLQKLKR
jgi:hypothetical protein